jgi:hypothetical protein
MRCRCFRICAQVAPPLQTKKDRIPANESGGASDDVGGIPAAEEDAPAALSLSLSRARFRDPALGPGLIVFVPPQSAQELFLRPCSQKPAPPQSLQRFFSRPCSHMLAPPHSLHRLRRRPCSQMLAPPQSLHMLFWRPCTQMPAPPQSLHWRFRRPCSQ